MYIPKINEKLNNLTIKEKKIKEGVEFNNFLEIIELNERAILTNSKRPLYQYYYTLNFGIDRQPLFFINVNKPGDVVDSYCYICRKMHSCHHLDYAINYVHSKYLESINDSSWRIKREEYLNEKFELEENRLILEKERLIREDHLNQISSLLESLNEQDIIPLANLVRVEPIINFNRVFDDVNITLELRLGIDKVYIVANIDVFLDAVINKEERNYGKYLVFNHMLENFDSISRDLIEYLIRLRKKRERSSFTSNNNREINLRLKDLEEIILINKDNYIEINGFSNRESSKNYLVSLNPKEVVFKLNENYRIIVEGLEEKSILDCTDKSFYLEDNEIKLITYPNKKMRPIYKFARKHKTFSFEKIKDVLEKEILARYYDNFKLADKIKPELEVKDFKIESYLDYDGNIIKLDSKFYYDNNLVEVSKLEGNKYLSFKIDKYNLVIGSLGFDDEIIKDAKRIFQFLKLDLSSLKDISTVYISDRLASMQAKVYKPVSFNLTYKTNMLEVCFRESEYSNEDLEKIIKALRRKQRYVKLQNNVILEIDDAEGEYLLNTIDEFNLDINKLLSYQVIPSYHALKLIDDNLNIVSYNYDNNLRELLEDISNYKNAKFLLPKHLKPIMRSYQKEAFLWMKTLTKHNFSGVLADDMGLGKTLEMISVIISDEDIAPSLIVCPKSLTYNWKNEFELWSSETRVVNIIGSSSERELIIKNINNNERVTYITSYDSLRNDVEFYHDKEFLYTVLDEGQFIKNHETLKAQSVKSIVSKYRFVLTGTPVENSVMDLWSIFDFLMPGYLGSLNRFKKEYERAIVIDKDQGAINNLVQKISPFILRRIKEDVITDLPEKTYYIQAAKMTNEQQMIYDAKLLETKEVLKSNDNKIELLAAITRLRQICVHPGLFIEGYNGGSAKLDLALELIENYIDLGHRIILFSQFTSVFDFLEVELINRNIKHFILTGKTEAKRRLDMANEFNQNEAYKVFLVSLKAGGTGLNLTGADVVIHLDPWWNVAVENQATDRSHRIGQTRLVQVVKLVCEDSIEQKVLELQEKKKELAKLLVADDDQNIQKLSIDDINFILN